MDWGSVLKKVKKIAGWNAEEIGKKINLSGTMVRFIMRGEREAGIHAQKSIREMILKDKKLSEYFPDFEKTVIEYGEHQAEKPLKVSESEIIDLKIRAEVAEKLNEQLMIINDRLIKACGEGAVEKHPRTPDPHHPHLEKRK